MGVFTGTLLGAEGEREQVYLVFILSLFLLHARTTTLPARPAGKADTAEWELVYVPLAEQTYFQPYRLTAHGASQGTQCRCRRFSTQKYVAVFLNLSALLGSSSSSMDNGGGQGGPSRNLYNVQDSSTWELGLGVALFGAGRFVYLIIHDRIVLESVIA